MLKSNSNSYDGVNEKKYRCNTRVVLFIGGLHTSKLPTSV